MTTATSTASEQEALPEVIPDPAYVRTETPNGVPLFLIAHPAAFDQIESQEDCPSIYFVLMGLEQTKGSGTTKIEWSEPTLFKRIARSAVGNGLIKHPITDGLGLATMDERAYWTLPMIPLDMVRKLEGFFRAAYKKHGSEAIVMLTYDPEFAESENPAGGWGILVPKQVNSSGHCKYEWDSVMEDKPPHVDIVGSVHSHPNMSAFASHTDGEDQYNWDGLHITIGWMNSKNNGEAEWHVEFQLNNRRFEFGTDQVFETVQETNEFEDDAGWLDRIEKQTTTYAGKGSGTTGRTGSYPTGSRTGSASGRRPTTEYAAFFRDKHNSKRPNGCPDLVKNTVLVDLLEADKGSCPVCDQPLGEMGVRNRRCTACFTYLLVAGESPEDLLQARRSRYGGIPYVPGLEYLMNREGGCPVILWEREEDGSKKGTDILWTPPKAKGGSGTS